jgi:hypothetical protein
VVATCGRSRNLNAPPILLTLASAPLLLVEKKLASRGSQLNTKWLLAVIDDLEAAYHLLDGELGEVKEGLHR